MYNTMRAEGAALSNPTSLATAIAWERSTSEAPARESIRAVRIHVGIPGQLDVKAIQKRGKRAEGHMDMAEPRARKKRPFLDLVNMDDTIDAEETRMA